MSAPALSVLAATLFAAFVSPTPAAQAPQKPALVLKERNVAILIYPEVELLDFAGPGEVFAQAHTSAGHSFRTYTVARSREPITSMAFVQVTPQYTLEDCPKPDIVVIPGGSVPADDPVLIEWVRARAKDTELMMSVCNGALVYAAAGLLKDLEVTTHRSALEAVALREPTAKVYSNRRFVDNGRVLTAAGIAAGIDGALHVVERFCGSESAWNAARNMEYDWRPDEVARLHAQPGVRVDGLEGMRLAASVRKLGLEGALAEYKQSAEPQSEQTLNTWGYRLLRAERVDDAVEILRLAAQAFPTSANAADSLSEALEQKPDAKAAIAAARECLKRLEADKELKDERRQRIRNNASSRVARLGGAAAAQLRFTCPPCNSPCDKIGYLEAGRCPTCTMELVERTN